MSEDELTDWGWAIGREAAVPMVIVLRGELGAGKTTLARAIARGAGVRGAIPSPTYNLLFRYAAEGDREVVHIDLYRLENENEIWALAWSELPGSRDILLIEWGERAESQLPSPRWEVSLKETEDPNCREVSRLAVGTPPALALWSQKGDSGA